MPQPKVKRTDFCPISLLAKGSFGKVILVKKLCGADRGTCYAMKVMDKSTSRLESLKELRVLKKAHNKEFLVQLKYAFTTVKNVYFAMEYLAGGDFLNLLKKNPNGLRQKHVKFYTAEIICGIDALHRQKLLHRDLKPANVMLDCNGHVVITDLGMCGIIKKRMSICGTLCYVAPEIIRVWNCGELIQYTPAVDWWAVGVLIYELFTGYTPFNKNNDMQGFTAEILQREPIYPKKMSREAKEMLKGFLNKNPKTRLGSGATTSTAIRNIRNLAFFKNLNWNDVRNKKLRPPYVPEMSHEFDTRHFPQQNQDDEVLTDDQTDVTFSVFSPFASPGRKKPNTSEASKRGTNKKKTHY